MLHTCDMIYVAVQRFAEQFDFTYALLKMHYGGRFPDRTGFNVLLLSADQIPLVSKIVYLSVIDASPTEYRARHTE